MEIIYTKDKDWIDKWDTFIINNDKGSHLMLSDWIKSYQSYGFDYEFCIGIYNDIIIGGYGVVIAKALVFKFFIVPYGPIVTKGYEGQFNQLIATVPERAKYHKSCYCHITLPFSQVSNARIYNVLPELSALNNAKEGHLFKYVYSSSGLNWIDLKGFDDESKIMTLKSAVRRNIRNSYRKGLILELMDSNVKLEVGYRLFIENSRLANYSIREWYDIKESIFALQEKGLLKMLGAYKNGELKGAILLVKSGNYFTYILGGSKKEVPDLRTGDFLQWEAVKLSFAYGFDGYNISLGGSKGVIEFKNSFNTEQIEFENSKFHWILKPSFFNMFLLFEKHLKPHKKKISMILSIFKEKK
jgi:hypothetical protein